MARTNIDASQILDGSIKSADLDNSSVTVSKINICRPYSDGTAHVMVDPGVIRKTDNSGSITFAGGPSATFGVVNPGNGRYDLLCIDNSGVLSIIQGVESVSPVVPNYPTDRHVLAEVYINEPSNVIISDSDIKDVRGFISMGGGSSGGGGSWDYIATQNIELGNNYISNDGSNAGISIDSNNYVIIKDQLSINTGMYGNMILSNAGINYPSNLYVHSDGNLVLSGGSSGTISVNGSSGFVGIGVGSPQYKLDVNGSINITGQYLVNGSPISGGSSSSISFGDTIVSVVDLGGGEEKISFSVNTVEKVYLTSTSFNIGTATTINAALNVTQNVSFSNNLSVLGDIYVGDINATDNIFLYADVSSSNKPYIVFNRQDGEWGYSNDGGANYEPFSGPNNFVSIPAGENITAGNAVYINSNGVAVASNSSSNTVPCMGIAINSATTGNSVKIQIRGLYSNNGYSFANMGKPVFLGASGGLTQTPPTSVGSQVQVIGFAAGSDTIFINPDYTVLEV